MAIDYSKCDLRNYKRPSDASLRYFGLTAEQHVAMWLEQNGQCAICGTDEYDLGKRLHIDHRHASGFVRGLLCRKCNFALGFFVDDIARMEKAIDYIHYAQTREHEQGLNRNRKSRAS